MLEKAQHLAARRPAAKIKAAERVAREEEAKLKRMEK
jgi:hypothetical protein